MILEIMKWKEIIIFSSAANLLIIGLFMFFIYKMNKNKNRLKDKIGELEIISDQSRQKEYILQSLQNANKKNEKYISILNREINKPFTSLLSATNSLEDEYDFLSNEEKMHVIKQLNTTIISSINNFQNLFAWIKFNSGAHVYNPCVFMLKDCIAEVVKNISNYASRKKILYELDIQPELYALADKMMVNTIIRNLYYFAIEASDENSKIIIQAFNTANTIKICFQYTGGQITEYEKNILLNDNISRFSKEIENEDSTGLSLVLVKEFVKKNGGELWINSGAGNENKFTFTLTNQK